MRNFLKKLVGISCIAILLFTTTQHGLYKVFDKNQAEVLPAAVKKFVYLDPTFTSTEKVCIRRGINMWNKATHGLVRIAVKDINSPSDMPDSLGVHHIVFQRMISKSAAAMVLDKIGGGKIYGFYNDGEEISQIYLVVDRLSDPLVCKSVVAHEIGHALGLEHLEKPFTLMFDDVNGMSKNLTVDDMRELCRKYDCELQE